MIRKNLHACEIGKESTDGIKKFIRCLEALNDCFVRGNFGREVFELDDDDVIVFAQTLCKNIRVQEVIDCFQEHSGYRLTYAQAAFLIRFIISGYLSLVVADPEKRAFV